MEFPAMEHFWLVRNGMGFHIIRFFGYMDWILDIWNFLRLLSPVYEAVDCKTDGINAHTIWDHILRKIQEEFKGVVT